MRARFASMLGGYEQGREGAAASRSGWVVRWWRQPLVQLAAAAVLLALGVTVGRATRPAPAADEMASVRSELREMRQMVTLTLMQQQSASDRIKGVNWSSTLERPGNEVVSALLDTLLHEIRTSTYGSPRSMRSPGSPASSRCGRGRSTRCGRRAAPMVQIALIDFVVGVKDTGSIDTLKKLVADPSLNETVRRRAAQGLDRLGAKS
jgi:hypothetical protein